MIRKILIGTIAACTLPLVLLTACKSNDGGAQPKTTSLSGAGSTFVFPAMSHWTDAYQQAHPNVKINYQSIGSGGGIQQVRAGTVDFGASDVALTDDQLKTMPAVLQIPETAGPVCITYNLPDVKQPLQLTPAAIAGIYMGTIKTWQDPEIVKSNPGVKLPKTAIVVVHRADGSGTTGIFTEYVSAVSPEWKACKMPPGGSSPTLKCWEMAQDCTGRNSTSIITCPDYCVTYTEQNVGWPPLDVAVALQPAKQK